MKKTKIIVPALGLLLLSTAASVTGTVAWFSANTDVDVTGMTVKTKVSGNLLIADHNVAGTGEEVDSMYTASNHQVNFGTNDIFLEPVSTVNGEDFFYSKEDVKGDGSIVPTTGYAFQEYDPDDTETFAQYYLGESTTDDARGYIDYEFYLKGTSTAALDEVFISKCNMLYKGEALGSQKDALNQNILDNAWRVAIFADEIGKNEADPSSDTLVSILRLSGAEYFGEDDKAISAADGTQAAIPLLDKPALLGTITNAGDTQRFHVIVRLWLEGEDTSCNNETFALLKDAYTLDLTCALKASGATSPATVTNISSVKPATSI